MFQNCDSGDCFNLRPGLGDGPSDAPLFAQTGYDDFGRPIAVDFQGNVFENIGGNDVSGGAVWAPVEFVRFDEPPPLQINRPDDTPILISQIAPVPAPAPVPVFASMPASERTPPALSPVLSPVAPSRDPVSPAPAPVPAPSIFAPAPAPTAGSGSTGGGSGAVFARPAPLPVFGSDGGGSFVGPVSEDETEIQTTEKKSAVPLAVLLSLALALLPG